MELEKKRQRKDTIEKTRKRKKEKQIQYQAKKKQKSKTNVIPRIVTALSKSVESSDNIFNRQSSANTTFGSLDDVTTRDILDEFLEDLAISDRDDWHKWLAVAMLYEYETDDVLKGLWLYEKKKTTADFYEQIYGKITKPFDEYLRDWNETGMDDDDDNDDSDSMTGADSQAMVERNNTLQSIPDSTIRSMSPSPSMPDNTFNVSKKDITQKNIFDQQRPNAMSTYHADGHLDQISISGPKQLSVFDALSTAPQTGLAPIVNKNQVDKLSRVLDI